MLKYKLKILLSKEYMRRIIIIENSGKVNFGGGQKITLQVAEILSKTCELVFVDFAKGTRFEQMINEKFQLVIRFGGVDVSLSWKFKKN